VSDAKSSRSYSDRTLKILWGRSAGRCAVPECRVELLVDETEHDPVVVIGDIAHIEASSDKGPRANTQTVSKDRDQYDNLILLCKNCHTRMDGQNRTNTMEAMKEMRRAHEEWVRASLPERGQSTTGWTPVVLQGEQPVDPALLTAALSPDFPRGTPIILRVSRDNAAGTAFLEELRGTVGTALATSDPFNCRFAIFPLASVPASIALGYVLTSRPRVRLFQFHRDSQTWRWPNVGTATERFIVEGLDKPASAAVGHVAICFHLSAQILREHTQSLVPTLLAEVHVSVTSPSTSWLSTPNQLEELGRTARAVFETLARKYPNAAMWHLFYAGPAPEAVKVGQQLNPTMIPPVAIYSFLRSAHPAYQLALTLEATQA
jgi:hypothetical protein